MRTDLLKYAFQAPIEQQAAAIEQRPMHAGQPIDDLATRLAYIQGALAGTPYDNWMMFTDDSFWEPSVDYSTLAPFLGTICTRGGGPSNWTLGAPSVPDKYWFAKSKAIRETGLSLGSYWVPNFADMLNDFKNPAPIIDQMKTAYYGEFMPDWLAIDFEIEYYYTANGTKVTIPNPNLVTGMGSLLEAVWEEFRRTTFCYSRVTFLQQTGLMSDGTDGMRNVFDTKNAGGTRFPLWLAYWPSALYTSGELSPDPTTVKQVLPPKTATNKKYLEYGLTNPAHIAWQFSPKKMWQGVTLDWSVFPMTRQQWEEWIGFTSPKPPPVDDPELAARVAALEAQAAAQDQQIKDIYAKMANAKITF